LQAVRLRRYEFLYFDVPLKMTITLKVLIDTIDDMYGDAKF